MEEGWPGPSFAKVALESTKLEIKWSVQKPPLTYSLAEFIQPCIVQFALASKQWRADILKKLANEKIYFSNELDSAYQYLRLTVTTVPAFESEKDVKSYVHNALLESFREIDCLKINKSNSNCSAVFQLQKDEISSLVSEEKLMLFNGKEAMYLAARKNIIESYRNKFKLNYSEIPLLQDCKKPDIVIKIFQFDKKLKSQHSDVEIVLRNNTVWITGSAIAVEKAAKKMKHLWANVTKETVEFDKADHLKLLLDEEGIENVSVLDFFRKSLTEKKIVCHVETGSCSDGPCVYVYSLNKESLKKAEEVVRGCVNDQTVTKQRWKRIEPLVKGFLKEKKLKLLTETEKSVYFICTRDISVKLNEDIRDSDDRKLPPILSDYLSHHGKKNLEKLAEEKNVSVTVDQKKHILSISGNIESIKAFTSSFKDSYACVVVSVDVTPSLIYDCQDSLSRIAASHRCCVETRFAGNKEPLPEDLKYVVSWQNKHLTGKVTLVSGNMEDLRTDFRIVFVTDTLFPLHKTSLEEHKKYVTYPTSGSTFKTSEKMKLGQAVPYRKEGKCTTKAIVVSKANSTSEGSCIDRQTLKTSLLGLLEDAEAHSARRIAIAIGLIDERLMNLCMATVLSVQQRLLQFETYLFCPPNTVDETAQVIDDQYQKEGRGHFREVHMDNINLKKDYRDISVNVEIASIVDMKADVIVNTVHPSLELKKGRLSRQILSKAGEEIQSDCKKQYPKGIQEGEIATTRSGNLKMNAVKKIFHCALPAFKKSTFVKNVKSMVRNCLLEMDIENHKTIAFPAFGTGNLGYPVRDTAKAMFDAVEEYKRNSINSGVTKVSFVLYEGDTETCHAFCDEEIRYKSKRRRKDEKHDFLRIYTDVGAAEQKVRLNVVMENELVQPSSNVVVVNITFQKAGGNLELKHSSTKPETWNDELKLYIGSTDLSSLKDAVVRLMEYCRIKKITEVLIPTNNGIRRTAVEQINVIKEVVQEFVAQPELHLQQVHITVTSSDSLHVMLDQLNSLKGNKSDYLSSITELSEKQIWRLTACGNFADIKIVGMSMDSVKQTELELRNSIFSLNSQKQKEAGGAIPKKKMNQVPPTVCDKTGLQNQPDNISEDDLVSAEINPGIIKYLKQNKKFDAWKEAMQSKYQVRLQKKEDAVVICKGSFPSILSFESYLDSTFLSSQVSPDDDNSKQERTCPCNGESAPDMNITAKTEGTATTQAFADKHNETSKPPASSTNDTKRNGNDNVEKYKNIFENYEIAIIEGDIAYMSTDCIVRYTNEILVPDGAGNSISSSRGYSYSQETAKKREVGLTDCLVTDDENLRCKKVIGTKGPEWKDKTKAGQILQDNVERCLEKADQLKFLSVSLPVVYPGSENVSPELLLQSYVGALKSFSKRKQYVSKVLIVEKDPKIADSLMKSLDVIISTQCAKTDTKICPDETSIEIVNKQRRIKIYSVLGNLESLEVAAVVSTENKDFSGKSRIAKALLSLGNDDYRKEHAKLSGRRNAAVGAVIETRITGGQLTCQYVLHTVVPRRNRDYCKDTFKFERDIKLTVRKVLNKASQLHCNSLALPLFGISEEEDIPTPVETCCKVMFKEIAAFLQDKENTSALNRIDLVSTDEVVVQTFCSIIQDWNHQGNQQVHFV